MIKSSTLHLPASLLHQKLGLLPTSCAEGWAHRQGILGPRTAAQRWLWWSWLPTRKRSRHADNHPLPSFSFTPSLVPGPSLHPPAPGTAQQPHTKYLQQKGSTDTAKWPLLLYNPTLKLFWEIHSFAILDVEVCFYNSFTCSHNSGRCQVRREHNGKITFGSKMFIILHCKGKKIVKTCDSFLLEKHEGKSHTISNAISSLNQPHYFFCCVRQTQCNSVTAWLSGPYSCWAQLMHS